jgi:hypothetical protein
MTRRQVIAWRNALFAIFALCGLSMASWAARIPAVRLALDASPSQIGILLFGIAAGSIFTFSLSLGDYIAVTIVGGKTQMLGNIIYGQLVTANNQPLAAALSIIPLAAVILYLLAMRRTGALENV